MWRFALIALAIGIMALVVAACGGGGSSSSSSEESSSGGEETTASETSGGEEPSSSEPIVFGGVYGPPAAGGKGPLQGMEVAAAQLNEEGGIDGRKVEIKSQSTDASPEAVVAAYRELGQDPNVMGVSVGFIGTPAIRGISESVGVPEIDASGDAEIYEPAVKYIFGNSYTGEYATAPVVHAVEEEGVKTIAVIHYEAGYSHTIQPALEARCKELGCEVLDVEEGKSTDSAAQLEPALIKMRSTDPDMYYVEGMNPNGFKAMETLGMLEEGKVVVSDNWLTSPEVAKACGKSCENIDFATSKIRLTNLNELEPNDPMKKKAEEYLAEYEKVFPGQEFTEFSTYGYDAAMAMAFQAEKAAEEGKEISRESIAEGLQTFQGKEFLAFTGYYESSPSDHVLVGPDFSVGYILANVKIENGEAIYYLAPNTPASGAES